MLIPLNKPTYTGNEEKYVLKSIKMGNISGDGYFSKKCQQWFEENLNCKRTFLTPSCTSALEMCALLIGIKEGDEVIMPSYTFVSTANAFALRGAKIKFVDIRPDTMNIDESKIEEAVTEKTKAVVVVHYAGVPCEMDKIMETAKKYNLYVIEDAAQGMMSQYKGKYLGTIGDFGTYSFHETKNYTSGGEGGLLIVNNEKFQEKAEIIREKGTNRAQFFRKEVDKYTWVDLGSSYLMNDLSASYLWGQLEFAEEINKKRLNLWYMYYNELKELEEEGFIELPNTAAVSVHNGRIFYIKLKTKKERDEVIKFLKENNISSAFHFVPLHSSPAGKTFGNFVGEDEYTTKESDRLLRLPIFYNMEYDEAEKVINTLKTFKFSKPKAILKEENVNYYSIKN